MARNIEFCADGYWRSIQSDGISYPEWGNEACFEVEDGSFWFQHRNDCILKILESYPPGAAFFDVGGGNGFVAKAVQDAGIDVVLIEPGPVGVRNALRRGVRQALCGTLEQAGFLENSIPSVGLFDVIEHIQDDREFLNTIRRHLQPDGRLYVTTPAFNWLWSNEDVLAGHFRRYTERGLRTVCESAGFAVEFITTFFNFLPLPILAFRALPNRMGIGNRKAGYRTQEIRRDHDLSVSSPLVQSLIGYLCRMEKDRIAAGRLTRFGASYLLAAKRVR
jgi:SAM-dependent methyltransferase